MSTTNREQGLVESPKHRAQYDVGDYLIIYCGLNEGCCFYVRGRRCRDDGVWEYDTGAYGWRSERTVCTEAHARLYP